MFFATHNNPLFMRLTLLQLVNQSRKPDIVAIHQNGEAESYWHFANDIDLTMTCFTTPHDIPSPTCEWQRVALEMAVGYECDVYFYLDHDNIVHRDHILNALEFFPEYDIVACKSSDMLFLWRKPFQWKRDVDYKTLSGFDYMESSVAFSHKVALEVLAETKDSKRMYGRVFQDIAARHKMKILDTKTVCFVSHPESTTGANLEP